MLESIAGLFNDVSIAFGVGCAMGYAFCEFISNKYLKPMMQGTIDHGQDRIKRLLSENAMLKEHVERCDKELVELKVELSSIKSRLEAIEERNHQKDSD